MKEEIARLNPSCGLSYTSPLTSDCAHVFQPSKKDFKGERKKKKVAGAASPASPTQAMDESLTVGTGTENTTEFGLSLVSR